MNRFDPVDVVGHRRRKRTWTLHRILRGHWRAIAIVERERRRRVRARHVVDMLERAPYPLWPGRGLCDDVKTYQAHFCSLAFFGFKIEQPNIPSEKALGTLHVPHVDPG